MSRVKEIRAYMNELIMNMDNKAKVPAALEHLYGVSLAATMIARKRGQNSDLAAIAGMMHDISAYKTGSYDDHAHKGADMAREVLVELGLTDQEETEIICSAIYHHDDKLVVDSVMDEVLKDADVFDHCMTDLAKAVKDKEKARFAALQQEFGFLV